MPIVCALSTLVLSLLPVGCAVGSSGAVTSSSVAASQAAASTGVVQASFFGMVVKNPAHQPTVATGARRLCDAAVTWAALEPAPNTFTWTSLDAEVAAAAKAGAEMTLTLGMTPAWASSAPSAGSAWGAGATVMPQSLSDWDAYVTAVVTRYKGQIAHYEVWNNPADAANWSGVPAALGTEMATLSAHTQAAVAAVDPAATVVAPAMPAGALGDFLAAQGARSVAAIAVALSPTGSGPEAIADQLQTVRATLAADPAAELLPLWNDQPTWTLSAEQVSLSDADQAAYAARALILNASLGVQKVQWYAWDETEASVLRLSDANGQATAAAKAYATVQQWLTGAALNGCSGSATGVWTCGLVRDGAPQWILWSTGGTVEASSLGMATATGLDGSVQDVAGVRVEVEGSPVLLQ